MADPLVLSLDPSSQRTGWAVLDYQERLHAAGPLTPRPGVTTAPERIGEMVRDLPLLLGQFRPAAVAIEWPSGHGHRRRHQGGGAGLAVYGAAVGACWWQVTLWAATARPEPQAMVQPKVPWPVFR